MYRGNLDIVRMWKTVLSMDYIPLQFTIKL